MAKPTMPPRELLAKNLNRLIDMQALTVYQVAASAKVTPKTLYSMLNAGHDARLKNYEKVAGVFGLTAWQLMAVDLELVKPAAQLDVLTLLEAYSSADEAGRKAIMQVAEIAAQKAAG
jgi:hypothetical protein